MNTWQELLETEQSKPYFKKLTEFVEQQYENTTVYPEKKDIYNAFTLTPYEHVNVVILGQDPYHGPHQAHGLSFSIASAEAKFPPSLRNVFKELQSDTGIARTNSNLTDWAEQGVMMLNTILTVEAGKAGSHRKKGWETLTDTVIEQLNEKPEQIIFVLWGADAQKKIPFITNPVHRIIKSVHPSPLAAHSGFFGSKPFSQINTLLKEAGKKEIVWG